MTKESSLQSSTNLVSEATLPTEYGEFQISVFQEVVGGAKIDHVALFMGKLRNGDLIRVHSECLTGEVFGSLRCDCAAQLDSALEKIAKEKRGGLIYLRQEGRGIGLAHKIDAYHKQDIEGLDTVDANLALDLPEDARTYDVAKGILDHWDLNSFRLLTNNPAKVDALKNFGFDVVREAHEVDAPHQSHAYLETKKRRMGHLLKKS